MVRNIATRSSAPSWMPLALTGDMGGKSDFDSRAATWDDDPAKVDRARRVADALAREVPDLEFRSVLDYGAGTGLLGFALLPRVRWVTFADVSKGMLAEVERKISLGRFANADSVLLDLTRDLLPGRQFDLVCTLLTLHHVPDVPQLLKAFHHVLAPGGVLCISDLDAEDGSFHGAGFDGHLGFERSTLASWLAQAGFGHVRFSTPCEIRKDTTTGSKVFPLFLSVTARS